MKRALQNNLDQIYSLVLDELKISDPIGKIAWVDPVRSMVVAILKSGKPPRDFATKHGLTIDEMEKLFNISNDVIMSRGMK